MNWIEIKSRYNEILQRWKESISLGIQNTYFIFLRFQQSLRSVTNLLLIQRISFLFRRSAIINHFPAEGSLFYHKVRR